MKLLLRGSRVVGWLAGVASVAVGAYPARADFLPGSFFRNDPGLPLPSFSPRQISFSAEVSSYLEQFATPENPSPGALRSRNPESGGSYDYVFTAEGPGWVIGSGTAVADAAAAGGAAETHGEVTAGGTFHLGAPDNRFPKGSSFSRDTATSGAGGRGGSRSYVSEPIFVPANSDRQFSVSGTDEVFLNVRATIRVGETFAMASGSARSSWLARFIPGNDPDDPPEEMIVRMVGVNVSFAGPTITASFIPNLGLTLEEAASTLGYDHFNWFQVVTEDPHPPGGLAVPYVDPPSGGGASFGGFADDLPFYWDEGGTSGSGYHLHDNLLPADLPLHERNELSYTDTPAEPTLTGDQSLTFATTLAGIFPDGSWEGLYTFTWRTDYFGDIGGVTGVRVRRNILAGDDILGRGGVGDLLPDV